MFNELGLMAPSIAAVSHLFGYFSYFRPVSAAFLTLDPNFFLKAEPQFLTGIFLNSGPQLNCWYEKLRDSMQSCGVVYLKRGFQ